MGDRQREGTARRRVAASRGLNHGRKGIKRIKTCRRWRARATSRVGCGRIQGGGTLREWWRDAGRREFRVEGREADQGARVRRRATTRRGGRPSGRKMPGRLRLAHLPEVLRTPSGGATRTPRPPGACGPPSPRGAPKVQGECELGGTPAGSSMFSMRATKRAKGVDV